MSDIVHHNTNGSALANKAESNPYLDYAASLGGNRIVGQLLKFSKFGEWTAGENATPIPMGTKMVAHVGEILVGWIKWQDNKPVEQIMGNLGDGYAPPTRKELGDDDKAQWEIGPDGTLRDPWQFANYLVLMDANGGLFTFAPSSKGGLQAVGGVAKKYGQRLKLYPQLFPVVKLGMDSYMHPNKAFGEIRKPILEVVEWVPRRSIDEALELLNGEGGDNGDKGEPLPLEEPAKPKPAPAPEPRPAAIKAATATPSRKPRF